MQFHAKGAKINSQRAQNSKKIIYLKYHCFGTVASGLFILDF